MLFIVVLLTPTVLPDALSSLLYATPLHRCSSALRTRSGSLREQPPSSSGRLYVNHPFQFRIRNHLYHWQSDHHVALCHDRTQRGGSCGGERHKPPGSTRHQPGDSATTQNPCDQGSGRRNRSAGHLVIHGCGEVRGGRLHNRHRLHNEHVDVRTAGDVRVDHSRSWLQSRHCRHEGRRSSRDRHSILAWLRHQRFPADHQAQRGPGFRC